MTERRTKTTRRFEVLEVSLQAIRLLRGPLVRVQSRDPRLGAQLRASASSVALNIAEGDRRRGKDRQHHFRIAAGSADESRVALEVATAWGYLGESDAAEVQALLDRVLAMLYRLTS